MSFRSGQVATEYLITVGVILVIVIPTAYLFYRQASDSAEEIGFAQIDQFGRDVIATAETVYYLGHPSRILLEKRLPDKVEGISVEQDPVSGTYLLSIAVKSKNGIMNFTYPSDVNIAGTFGEDDITEGVKKIRVEAEKVSGSDLFVTVNIVTFGIDSIVPPTGSPAGGDTVTISGSDFVDKPAVEFGGIVIDPSDVTFVSAVELTVITPAHALGAVDVTVTNPDSRSYTLTNGFTYVNPPMIDSIIPSSGPDDGGTEVTIAGSNFIDKPSVEFGAVVVNPSNVTFVSANQLTVITPAHDAGVVDVTVTNTGGQSDTDTFTYTSCIDNDDDGFYASSILCPEGDDCNDDPLADGALMFPGNPEVCNGINDDCDDDTDDGSGQDAPLNSNQDGVCLNSVQSCTDGEWTDDYSGVTGYEGATEVSCLDTLDNDCDTLEDLDDVDDCEPDLGQTQCTAAGYDWRTGGETAAFGEYDTGTSTECCRDDSGENSLSRQTDCTLATCNANDYPEFNSDVNDSVCCNDPDDTVFGGVCYTSDNDGGPPYRFEDGSISAATGGVVPNIIAENSVWYDCDNSRGACEELVSDGRCGLTWEAGGEAAAFGEYNTGTATECCGDDSGENLRSTDLGGTPYTACCNAAVDCVYSDLNCVADGGVSSDSMYKCVSGSWVVNCIDNDGDSYGSNCAAGSDCDDACGTCYPGNPEICDGKDNDCNAVVDDGCDDDNDNYCDSGMTRASPYSCSGTTQCCSLGGNDCLDSGAGAGYVYQNVGSLADDADQDRWYTGSAATRCVGAKSSYWYRDVSGDYTWLASGDALGTSDCAPGDYERWRNRWLAESENCISELDCVGNHAGYQDTEPYFTAFVSSVNYKGWLGDRYGHGAAADSRCNLLACNAGLSGSYTAWVDATDGYPWERGLNTCSEAGANSVAWYLLDGYKVADDWNDLTDRTIDHDIDVYETGSTALRDVDYYAWTGGPLAKQSGESTKSCQDWSKNTDSYDGSAGSTRQKGLEWEYASATSSCNYNWKIYCFQDSSITSGGTTTNGGTCSSGSDCCSGYCYSDADSDGYAATSGTKTCMASASLGTDCLDSGAGAGYVFQNVNYLAKDVDHDRYQLGPAGSVGTQCVGAKTSYWYKATSGTDDWFKYTDRLGYDDCDDSQSDRWQTLSCWNIVDCKVTSSSQCVGATCESIPPYRDSDYQLKYTVFLGSGDGNWYGNMGGTSGADSRCTSSAHAAGLSGSYTAWLANGVNDEPRDRGLSTCAAAGSASIGWYLLEYTNGRVVVYNWADLTDGTLRNSINRNEYGNSEYETVWSAVNTDGSAETPTCQGWTSNWYGYTGAAGHPSTTSSWTDNGDGGGSPSVYGCPAGNSVYCFQNSGPSNFPRS